jgi:hypothetical protein
MVITLTANTDTSVTRLKARSAVKAPRIAVTPMASGRPAATTLPKITTSNTSSTGMDSISARAMSELIRSSMSRPTVTPPPTWVSSPGAASESSIAVSPSVRCSSSPRSTSTAYVECRSALTSDAAPPPADGAA